MENSKIFRCLQLNARINCLKDLQREHKLFLDLDSNEVVRKYCETYPKGTNYIDFLLMICHMTKEDNFFNGVVVAQICTTLRKLRHSQ